MNWIGKKTMYCVRYWDLLLHCNLSWWWMALWVLMWQYGFILDLWLLLAIISIPWGYIVSEPLLALRSRAGDLIYLSQGLRDHPASLLYGIILCSLGLFLKGKKTLQCMQLHTCQTVQRFLHHEGWSTDEIHFKMHLEEKRMGLLTDKYVLQMSLGIGNTYIGLIIILETHYLWIKTD